MAARAALFAAAALCASAKTTPITDATTTGRACQPPHNTYPFCDAALSIEVRVADLIGRLQPEEIPPQLTARHNGGGSPVHHPSNISRLGIPDYDWGLNCIHGVQSSCVQDPASKAVYCPTSFPNPVNFGATWNTSMAQEMGAIIGTETRALWLAGATEESGWSGMPVIGLNVWSPTINLARDPRWGRNQEAPSESPLINGDYGTAYAIGVQTGEDARYFKTLVTLKHAHCYSLENSDGFTRHSFNALVSNATLADTYWVAFKAAITNPVSPPQSIMCCACTPRHAALHVAAAAAAAAAPTRAPLPPSPRAAYNAVNGIPSCGDAGFQQAVVRDRWNFSGFITSDTGAIEDFFEPDAHHWVKTSGEAACAALRGSTDLCSGAPFIDSLLAAVAAGTCSMTDVTRALTRTLTARFRLGLFDAIEAQPYWHVPIAAVGAPASLDASARVAAASMVLLKHDGAALPLAAGVRLAVIGPHAQARDALVGSYLGQLCEDDTTGCVQTPLAALTAANAGGVTRSAPGCAVNSSDESGFAAAVALAQASDVVVLMLGIDETVEGESNDRRSIDLPAVQHRLVSAVAAANTPIVIVLLNGGSLDVTNEMATPGVGAMLAAGYPGVFGAAAIAATLFGQNEHCCGKLSTTWYPASYTEQIKMSEMEWAVGPGRAYRYYTGEPVFPFGFGMALTTFQLANLTAGAAPLRFSTDAAAAGATAVVRINVTNTGARAGDEVVQLYAYPPAGAPPERPRAGELPLRKELLAYQRVHLEPGASQVVSFNVAAEAFAIVDRASAARTLRPATAGWRLEAATGAPGAAPVVLAVAIDGESERVVEAFPQW